MSRPGPRHRQQGSAALLTLASAMALLAVGLVTVVAAVDLGVAAARARTAADAAALAAAASSPLADGGDPVAAATRAAHANGATLLRCCDDPGHPWPLGARAEVGVAPAHPAVARFAPQVRARAAAALRPPDG